jgi:hypothetical protein
MSRLTDGPTHFESESIPLTARSSCYSLAREIGQPFSFGKIQRSPEVQPPGSPSIFKRSSSSVSLCIALFLGVTTATGTGGVTTAGTLNATQNNTSIVNTLNSTQGMALQVKNTTIGASGLTVRSITDVRTKRKVEPLDA